MPLLRRPYKSLGTLKILNSLNMMFRFFLFLSISRFISREPPDGSGPSCPLEGPPIPPIAAGGPFPQATTLPSPLSRSLFPPPPWLFFSAAAGGSPGWRGGGVLGRRGAEGGDPQAQLWPDPHRGVLSSLSLSLSISLYLSPSLFLSIFLFFPFAVNVCVDAFDRSTSTHIAERCLEKQIRAKTIMVCCCKSAYALLCRKSDLPFWRMR